MSPNEENDPIVLALRALPRLDVNEAKAARIRLRALDALADSRGVVDRLEPIRAFVARRVAPIALTAAVASYLVWAAQAALLLH